MSRRRAPALLTALLVLGLTGCASTVDPIERLGRKAVERVGPHGAEPEPPAGRASAELPRVPGTQGR
ncbi:hypothetical protein ACIOMM_09790 [Streptomyces sp. NPDC087908]|uniref:hypothetical protein n=1 Tax=unclassified Streptomyces TaxID=2593676 RepID=UPI0011CD36B6|nr:hypothetical protein [Streptomyces sp. adm13(2018)]TXS11033.1 hypothetical protein EAO70_29000 [Streptomyces sp. adm13(2018)]